MSSRVTDGFAGSPHGIVYAVETHGDLAAAQYSSILKYDLGSGRTGRDRDDVVTRYRIRDARREDADILAPASQRFTRLTIGTIGAPTCPAHATGRRTVPSRSTAVQPLLLIAYST
jgi:hypothetical protein